MTTATAMSVQAAMQKAREDIRRAIVAAAQELHLETGLWISSVDVEFLSAATANAPNATVLGVVKIGVEV